MACPECAGAPVEWWPVPDWPHTVSSYGVIRSAAGKDLATRPNNRPIDAPPELRYRLVTLCAEGRKKTFSVHRVVDAGRTGDWCPDGLEVSHVDDIKPHNHAGNLVRETHPENEMRKPEVVRIAAARAARAAQLPEPENMSATHVSPRRWWQFWRAA